MTAQTFTAATAKRNLPVPGAPGAGAGVLHASYGKFLLTEDLEVGDIYELCWLPKGAVPVGGYYSIPDVDTGTETAEIDVGIAANGVDSADPDFFTNSGVLTGDAITDLPLTNAANVRLFTGPFPVLQLGAKTLVQGEVIAVSATDALVTMWVVVYYLMPGVATS